MTDKQLIDLFADIKQYCKNHHCDDDCKFNVDDSYDYCQITDLVNLLVDRDPFAWDIEEIEGVIKQ